MPWAPNNNNNNNNNNTVVMFRYFPSLIHTSTTDAMRRAAKWSNI